MSEQTIGDYYERKQKEMHEAWVKWVEASVIYTEHPSYEHEEAMRKAEQAMIDAGNTGD